MLPHCEIKTPAERPGFCDGGAGTAEGRKVQKVQMVQRVQRGVVSPWRAMSIYAAFGGGGIASYEYTGKSRAVYSATRTGGSPAKRDRGEPPKAAIHNPQRPKAAVKPKNPPANGRSILRTFFYSPFPQPFYTTCGEAAPLSYILRRKPLPPPSVAEGRCQT